MTPDDAARFAPIPKLINYPGAIGVGLVILFTTVLLIVARKFDHTQGVLTVSLLVVLAFLGACTFALFFNIPTDEITSSILGGLTAQFGAIVCYWLGRPREPPK
jgi:hypothetical protein